MEPIEKIDGSDSIVAKNGFTENINIHLHEAAVKYKDRPAAWDSRGIITYDQLDRYSNAVCNMLLAEKEKTGSGNICIMTEARSERLCFIMGILKAGMTYIPLDTKAPSERNIHIADNTGSMYILSDDDNYDKALEIAKHSRKNVTVKALGNDRLSEMDDSYTEIRAGLDRIAYIIHTSGSTGKPKGVRIPDRALNNFCLFMTHELTNITPEDKTCAIQNVSFDASIIDMFPHMLSGSCIYFVPDNIRIDISKLNDFMIENGITIQMMTTALYNMFVEYDNPVLKKLFVGGEKMTKFTAGTYEVYNLYGPTEAAVAVTYHKVTEQSDNIPIGVP